MYQQTTVLGLILIAAAVAGCEGERLGRLAEQTTREQSAQNQRVSQAHASLVQGSQQLIQAESHARRDLAKLQQDLHDERKQIQQQRDALQTERQALALARQQQSTWSSGLTALGVLLACLAPLVLAGIALVLLNRGAAPGDVGNVLVEELARALEDHSPAARRAVARASRAVPRLPSPDGDS